MSETLIKTASVRIMISYNYSNFEVSMNLENETGLSLVDINNARIECQELASTAVSQYKSSNSANPKEEIKKIENKVAELKKLVDPEKKTKEITDPKEIEKIEKLPIYGSKKQGVKK